MSNLKNSKKSRIAHMRNKISGLFPYGDKKHEKNLFVAVRIIFEDGYEFGVQKERKINNDKFQFSRLLFELEQVGAVTPEVMRRLCEEMTLKPEEVLEILERASLHWVNNCA